MCFSLHPLSLACMCTFHLLYGIAGDGLLQSLIYSGPFEIIELTHLSDGERRNAKRSPGEVPAAPAPNLSCLQIAQSLHHNRWDSSLSFLPCSHTRACWSVHTVAESAHHTFPHMHTYTQRCGHTRHLSPTRWANRQRHVLYTSADTHTYIYSLSLLLSPIHSVDYSFSLGLTSMYKVSFYCLQGASLPHA